MVALLTRRLKKFQIYMLIYLTSKWEIIVHQTFHFIQLIARKNQKVIVGANDRLVESLVVSKANANFRFRIKLALFVTDFNERVMTALWQ